MSADTLILLLNQQLEDSPCDKKQEKKKHNSSDGALYSNACTLDKLKKKEDKVLKN